MPKINLEILRTVEITRDERFEGEVVVPSRVFGDPDALFEWVESELNKEDSDLTKATLGEWSNESETEGDSTIDEVTDLDDNV